jgi:hypothetical protein
MQCVVLVCFSLLAYTVSHSSTKQTWSCALTPAVLPWLLFSCRGVQAPGDEPVWRQLLRLHIAHDDPGVAQQAAAALAE